MHRIPILTWSHIKDKASIIDIYSDVLQNRPRIFGEVYYTVLRTYRMGVIPLLFLFD